MYSLTDISRGSVRIERNYRLCFANTIDWNRITTEGKGSNYIRVSENIPFYSNFFQLSIILQSVNKQCVRHYIIFARKLEPMTQPLNTFRPKWIQIDLFVTFDVCNLHSSFRHFGLVQLDVSLCRFREDLSDPSARHFRSKIGSKLSRRSRRSNSDASINK